MSFKPVSRGSNLNFIDCHVTVFLAMTQPYEVKAIGPFDILISRLDIN